MYLKGCAKIQEILLEHTQKGAPIKGEAFQIYYNKQPNDT